MRLDSRTRSSLVKSEPFHDCSIIEGGTLIVVSVLRKYIQSSLLTFSVLFPASRRGDFTTMRAFSVPHPPGIHLHRTGVVRSSNSHPKRPSGGFASQRDPPIRLMISSVVWADAMNTSGRTESRTMHVFIVFASGVVIVHQIAMLQSSAGRYSWKHQRPRICSIQGRTEPKPCIHYDIRTSTLPAPRRKRASSE